MDNAPALEVEELSVHFGETAALQDVSLGVNPGEYLLLTGPSGSGKSTLMRCLNGLIPHVVAGRMSGRVLVHGLDTREHEVAKLAETVGFVFQNPETQLFNLTVHDEVMFAPTNLGYSPSEAEDLGRRALRATGASHLEMRRLATLSGGEKQRVAIASVLALRPSILVLDEPTAHLDVSGSDAVLGSLTRLCKEEGVTVVLGEHRTGAAGRVADRMAVLEQGRLMAEGPTRHVFARRDLMRRLGIRRPADEPENPWETLIERPDPPAGIPPVAELRGVHAGYGKHEVLHGLDLAIYPGEILALVGDNGAGKTTVARLLSGLMSPQKGQVLIRGRKPRVDGGEVGLVVQNPMTQLFCETVEEEVSFGPTNLGRRDRGDTERAMDVCDLRDLANRPVHALSCGQQQRTVVASVLALGTGLLILDEPTMGQDWGHLTTMMSHLRRLTRAGCSIVLVTHDYKLVHHYADRVVLLRDGRVGAMGRLHRARSAVTMCAGIR